MKKTDTVSTSLLIWTIVLTNLTQMPQLISSGINSYITLACWGGLFLYAVLNGKLCIQITKFPAFIYAAVFLCYALAMQVFTERIYLGTALVYPYLLSVFVFLVGCLYSNVYNKIDIQKLYIAYIVSGIIVAISVFFDAFSEGFSWFSRVYTYESKNSVSQIILTVVLLLVFADAGKKIPQIIKTITAILLIVLMGMLKSRASLVGVLVIIIYILLSRKINKGLKILTFMITVSFVIAVYFNPTLNEIVIDGIIFAGRSAENLNDFSSGRVDMFGDFSANFSDWWAFGRGIYYLEAFPISLLMQYGIFGSAPIILYLILPFTIIYRMKYTANKPLIIAILICYYANGLFEELSPLGPGVKCYLLWFLLGLEAVKPKRNSLRNH